MRIDATTTNAAANAAKEQVFKITTTSTTTTTTTATTATATTTATAQSHQRTQY